jgi:ABC-2 type transport system permease protein
MREALAICRKELGVFFASPAAFIFLGVFVAACLFSFFWLDAFFARNIADVRPLFHWMPIVLIVLVGALSMRMWSEERRGGTLELVLTAPLPPSSFAIGKFLACLALVCIALALTLPIPLTVAVLGPLDWGPVIGAYAATVFVAGAYIAIGLFVSAKTDNQIVALILSVLICGAFYAIGSDPLVGMFGGKVGDVLKLLGSGSRFESIERGVIDLRDLYYYVSIAAVFLALGVLSLERLRWDGAVAAARHRRWRLITALLAANLLAGNLWLGQITGARVDLTQGHIYSISDTTRGYLDQLKEPLLIRGYFTARTHPLLAPLVPQLIDLLKEYEVAGHGKVRVEIIDPQQHPDLEKEANTRYGIRPVPFETSSKYQASVTNSYFNVVVQYGDDFEKLGFRDFIEVKGMGESSLSVDLRNPEYEITRAIRKVLYAYQGGGDPLASLTRPLIISAYVSPAAQLPKSLADLRGQLDQMLDELDKQSGGKLTHAIVDPDADGGAVAKTLEQDYGFQPMAASLADPHTFWFYLTLKDGNRVVEVPLPDTVNAASLKQDLIGALKQFSRGMLRTIAVSAPPGGQFVPGYGMVGERRKFQAFEDKLREEATVVDTDLKDGRVPSNADMLILLAPTSLDDNQVFAVDQFLMKGGTVMIATSPFDISLAEGLTAVKRKSGLEGWLKHDGVTVADAMVLDPQDSALPIPIERDIGGVTVREIHMLSYPYFVDVRGDGMPASNGPTAGIEQLTVPWAAPIAVDAKGRTVLPLLESSKEAWTSASSNVIPDLQAHRLGFPRGTDIGRKLLAVSVQGRFDSFFKGKPSPLLASAKQATDKRPAAPPPADTFTGKLDHSSDAARILLFASNDLFSDDVMQLASSISQSQYLAPLELAENAVDWSLEDPALMGIRGRGHYSRVLVPLDRDQQMIWEYLNYALALVGLALVWVLQRLARRAARHRYRSILAAGRA